jgi:hypothetical protein
VKALCAAGAERVFKETASGAKTDRAQLRRAIDALGRGDVLLVTRLDRLARSTRDLLNTLDAIAHPGAGFRSLADTWADTTTPHGRLMLTVLGGLAEFAGADPHPHKRRPQPRRGAGRSHGARPCPHPSPARGGACGARQRHRDASRPRAAVQCEQDYDFEACYMTNQSQPIGSKRIRAFCLDLATTIPKFPNDKASLQSLERKSLGSLLVDYANWAIRYVTPRPRKVVVESAALSDSRWTSLQADITSFLSKVERGDDLMPHLSIEPHTRGYTPAASGAGPNVDRWADKDMVLNITGYHHFHISSSIEPQGFVTRGNELLFAHVTRDTFTVVALFDHSVFEKAEVGKPLTAERERLWSIFKERSARHAPPNSLVVPSIIATSGHSMHFTFLAMDYARLISKIDPKLDESAYIASLVAGNGFTLPTKQKWKWHLNYLDLGVLEKNSGFFGVFRKGPN